MTASPLNKKWVSQGIKVVRDVQEHHFKDSNIKKPLLEDEGKGFVFLQVNLKTIPKSIGSKMIKVNLPHPLIKDTDEVCLIVGDLDKMNHKADIEPDILHYKGLLDRCGVTHVSEVITLRQLRTVYKPYEAKQKLLAAYDVFLVDNKITPCLPRVLGKHFFKKRKFPIQIDLKPSNLKQRIKKALSTKVFYITGQGNCCSSEVANLGMTDSEILENIMAMAETLHEKIPKTWDNIMGIYLKTSRSKAIPLYMSYEGDLGSTEESGKDWSELEEEAAKADGERDDFQDDYTKKPKPTKNRSGQSSLEKHKSKPSSHSKSSSKKFVKNGPEKRKHDLHEERPSKKVNK